MDFAEEMNKILNEYGTECGAKIKKAVDKTARQVKETIRAHGLYNDITGKYRDSGTIKTISEGKNYKTVAWCVKSPYYRLAHLLENGHRTGNGGKTRVYKHIKYGQEYAEKNLIPNIRRELEK